MESKHNAGAELKSRIYILSDKTLSGEDRAIVRESVSEIEMLFPMCETVNLDAGEDAPGWGLIAEDYLRGTINEKEQADGAMVLRALLADFKRFPRAGAVILLTGKDLYSSRLKINWCFGTANYRDHVAVQSVFRYKSLTPEEKSRCIRRTLRHELGHAMGMASDLRRVNTEERRGPHCTTPGCSMRQSDNLAMLLAHAEEEDREGTYFCRYCKSDLGT